MSKELPNLETRRAPEAHRDTDSWMSFHNRPDTHKPITDFIIGFVHAKEGYYPVEVILTKKQPKTIFLVGGEESGKEKFVKGMLTRASKVIAQGCMEISAVTSLHDPNNITNTVWVKNFLERRNYTHVPESSMAGKILEKMATKMDVKTPLVRFEKPEPQVLVLDNLGLIVSKIAEQAGKMGFLKKILNYDGAEALLTIATVRDTDMPYLRANGIAPDLTKGIWLMGKSENPNNKSFNTPPNTFRLWDNKRKEGFAPFSIIPFDDHK